MAILKQPLPLNPLMPFLKEAECLSILVTTAWKLTRDGGLTAHRELGPNSMPKSTTKWRAGESREKPPGSIPGIASHLLRTLGKLPSLSETCFLSNSGNYV